MSRRFKNLSLLLGPLAVALVPLLLLAQPPLFNYAPGARQATRQVSGVQAPTSVRGSAAFTPASIAGLQLWLDASQIVGLNDGDPVATWPDSSGNGFDATQATGSKQPTYQTNEINGRPAVQTDGVDDFIRATFATSQPFTRFSVLSTDTTGGATHVLGGVAANVALYNPASPLLQMYAGAVGPAANVASMTWVILVECYDGASSFVEINGVRSAGNPGTGSPGGVTIGASDGGASNNAGKFAEVIHYSARVSDGDIAAVVAYLASRYGL